MATQQDVEDLAEDIGIAIKGLIPNKTSDVTNDGDDGSHPFIDTSDIVNDLSTGGTTKVLSAEQGKALYDLVDEGTITELKELITDAITNNNGILTLTRNYKATSTDTQIIINNNLTILGNGHTIDADNLLSIIAISTSTNVTFDSLTILNSISTGNGGAIYNEGTLQLTNCTLANNTANNGGAIDNRATLTATDTTFINNQITSNTGEGGAIRGVSGATTTLINCTFINNKSAYRGGSIRFKEATISNCRFINNTATNNGGAIFITTPPTANISNTIFKDNTANNGASIYSIDSITTINCTYPTGTTTNVTNKQYDEDTFTDLQTLINSASNGDIINLDKDYKNTGNTPITFTNKTLTINANGHIIDGNNNSQVLNINTDANITINNAIIKNGYSDQYNGGAITLPSSTNSQLTLNNCTIIDNTLNGTGYAGAGAYVGANTTLIVNNCIFNNNTSNSNGGAIFGGSNSTVYINNSTFTNNTASSGGAIQNATCINTVFDNNTATANTGAGAIRDGTAINCTFQGNTAPQRTASGAMRNGTAINCRFITTTDTTDSTTVKDYVTT